MSNAKQQLNSSLILTLAAVIWGFSFVSQRVSMDYIGPYIFNGIRFTIGSLALIPVIFIMEKNINTLQISKEEKRKETKLLFKAGLICGVVLFVASTFQQIGIIYTSAGKTAFITALYIVLVPLLGLFIGHKTTINAWLGAVLGTVGLYLLCIKTGFSIEYGDLIILIASFFWAFHILFIDNFSSKVNNIKFASLQFGVTGILSLIFSFVKETTTIQAILDAGIPILYSSLLSVALAYTLQIIGQKNCSPAIASLILSTESVFGAIGGYLLLGEVLSQKEFMGCIIMFIAIIVSQLPEIKRKV